MSGILTLHAHMQVVGLLQQHLDPPDGNTYLGSGKITELLTKVEATGADTVIVDSELTPRQLRNLSRQLGDSVRLCDRTALILDIFKTRALSREGQLQVRRRQAMQFHHWRRTEHYYENINWCD